jgi:hypothetical protein
MDLTHMTPEQVSNALDYLWESEDIEADMASGDERDGCKDCGTPECSQPDPQPTVEQDAQEGVYAAMRAQEAIWQAEFDEQKHEGYRIGDLRLAFDRVKNGENWKYPIATYISETVEDITRVAIIFFTGSTPHFTPMGGGWLRVEADGYYRAVGA